MKVLTCGINRSYVYWLLKCADVEHVNDFVNSVNIFKSQYVEVKRRKRNNHYVVVVYFN